MPMQKAKQLQIYSFSPNYHPPPPEKISQQVNESTSQQVNESTSQQVFNDLKDFKDFKDLTEFIPLLMLEKMWGLQISKYLNSYETRI